MRKNPDIIFMKTSNHIYEVCESFAVMGVSRDSEEHTLTLELCRDVVEIKQGQIEAGSEDEAQMTRLNFATISLSVSSARKLMNSLERTLKNLEQRKKDQTTISEQE